MGLDQWIKYEDDNGCDVEKSYRKVNWLRGWVIDNSELTHESNFQEAYISRNKLKELLENCNYVLENKDKKISDENLPTLGGFFFGDYEYNDYYYSDVEQVKKDIEEILSNKSVCEVTYLDWW